MNSMIDLAALVNLVEWLVMASLKTIPLIGLVYIVQKLCRHLLSAAARHLLWFTVLVSLMVPVGWDVNIKVPSDNFFSEVPQVQFEKSAFVQSASSDSTSISAPDLSTLTDATELTDTKIEIGLLIAIVWLVGVVILLVVTLIKSRTYYRIKRHALIVPPDVAELFERSKQKMHFSKHVDLYSSGDITTPIAMGVLHPTIIIPLDIEKALTPEQLQYVLLHELGHIKRHDIVFNWVVSVINIFHWFNPFVWFACRRMRTDMEAACDALVLSHLPKKQHKNYGETLIELSDFLPYSSRAPSAVGILENHHELKERLKMIKQITTMNVKRAVIFGVILVSTTVVAFAKPSQKAVLEQASNVAQTMSLQAFAVVTEKILKMDVSVGAKDADTSVRIRTNISQLDYPALLTQLKQNGFTAYKSNGGIHFIQIQQARDAAIPVVENNKTYFDDEYVTESIKPEKACGSKLLPALRPLVPREGHMTISEATNMIIVVDTYSNIQRLKTLIKQIDDGMQKAESCAN